jgi:hypothetical protein
MVPHRQHQELTLSIIRAMVVAPRAAVISLIGAAVLRHEPIRLIIDSAITMQRKMLAPRA